MKKSMKLPEAGKTVSMDQHFMENEGILRRMVFLADLKPEDRVLEIGPGAGNLTRHLLGEGIEVTAVEKDVSFEDSLRKEFGHKKNLNLIFGNALGVIEKIKFNKIVSNLPYSICEPFVNKLMKIDFDIAVVSVPENFASILLAKPGERQFSKLSIRSQSFFDVKVGFKVPRSAFVPEPKTESVVLVIRPLSKKYYRKHPGRYVLREIFLQNKKKIKNALREGLISLNKHILEREFTKNLAREMIKNMEINGEILGKGAGEINLAEMEELRKAVTSLACKLLRRAG